ncbi:MAG: prepilin-type N-terminal cleavage/methylation domain-containing protein [Deltaproteobacteria bacterium]|nr:prepilin-type N-terminal cleavage/methylation domain-containing protein [Deltaproteobacteria bacterium]
MTGRNRKVVGGFSLIELMIVVAILGILAAVALSAYRRFVLRSKAAEASVNIKAIAIAEEGYYAAKGNYIASGPAVPNPTPGNRKYSWTSTPLVNRAGFERLGWEPAGDVYFSYAVSVDGGAKPSAYTIDARGDLDGDAASGGAFSNYGYVSPKKDNAGVITTPAPMGAHGVCTPAGVFDFSLSPPEAKLLRTFGACDASTGGMVF